MHCKENQQKQTLGFSWLCERLVRCSTENEAPRTASACGSPGLRVLELWSTGKPEILPLSFFHENICICPNENKHIKNLTQYLPFQVVFSPWPSATNLSTSFSLLPLSLSLLSLLPSLSPGWPALPSGRMSSRLHRCGPQKSVPPCLLLRGAETEPRAACAQQALHHPQAKSNFSRETIIYSHTSVPYLSVKVILTQQRLEALELPCLDVELSSTEVNSTEQFTVCAFILLEPRNHGS